MTPFFRLFVIAACLLAVLGMAVLPIAVFAVRPPGGFVVSPDRLAACAAAGGCVLAPRDVLVEKRVSDTMRGYDLGVNDTRVKCGRMI